MEKAQQKLDFFDSLRRMQQHPPLKIMKCRMQSAKCSIMVSAMRTNLNDFRRKYHYFQIFLLKA